MRGRAAPRHQAGQHHRRQVRRDLGGRLGAGQGDRPGRPGADAGERTLIPSSASGSAETLPGSALGTPAYMSPEQAEGDIEHLGPRSDVYSLGGTLYYLLTGRPPLEGDIGEVLRAAQRGEFAPPRRHDPTIDAALEAVCLKAMAHRPAERYASPRALSEDIERWMADEPVSAWREPLSRRVRRWANRNRTAVASVAVALIAGVVGLSAVLAVQTSAKAAVTRALAGERDANRALAASNDELAHSKAAVQARYDLAVEAIQAFHTGVSEDFLLKQDQFKELRDRLLRSAQDFYGKLSALLGRETDPASRRALLASNFELAELTGKVGTGGRPDGAPRRAGGAGGAGGRAGGRTPRRRSDVGRSLTAVAGLLEATGKTDEALATYRRSESLLAGPAGTDPAARARAGGLPVAARRSPVHDGPDHRRTGGLPAGAGRPGGAWPPAPGRRRGPPRPGEHGQPDRLPAWVGRAGRRRRRPSTAGRWRSSKAGRRQPRRHRLPQPTWGTATPTSATCRETGKLTEAEAEFRRRWRSRRSWPPTTPPSPNSAAACRAATATSASCSRSGQATEAEAEFRRALEILQKLAADHPAVTEFRNRPGEEPRQRRRPAVETGKPQRQRPRPPGAGDLPEAGRRQPHRHRLSMGVGRGLQQPRPRAVARGSRRGAGGQGKASSIRQRLVDANPELVEHQIDLAYCHDQIGDLLLRTGKPVEAWRSMAQRCPSIGSWPTPTPATSCSWRAWAGAPTTSAECMPARNACRGIHRLRTGLAILPGRPAAIPGTPSTRTTWASVMPTAAGPGSVRGHHGGRRRPAPGRRDVATAPRHLIRSSNGPGRCASGRAGQGPEVRRD